MVKRSNKSLKDQKLAAALYYARQNRLARIGKAGGVYSQNLYQGYIYIQGGTDLDNSNKIEISMWIIHSPPGTEPFLLFSDDSNTKLILGKNGTLRFAVESPTGSVLYDYRSFLAVKNGSLSHIYVSFDGVTGTPKIYIDGVEDDLVSGFIFTPPSTGIIHVGSNDLLALSANVRDVEDPWGDLWVNNPSTFVGYNAFWNGGTPPDLSTLDRPVIWLGGDQLAADIAAGGNNGTATLTPDLGSTLTDV